MSGPSARQTYSNWIHHSNFLSSEKNTLHIHISSHISIYIHVNIYLCINWLHDLMKHHHIFPHPKKKHQNLTVTSSGPPLPTSPDLVWHQRQRVVKQKEVAAFWWRLMSWWWDVRKICGDFFYGPQTHSIQGTVVYLKPTCMVVFFHGWNMENVAKFLFLMIPNGSVRGGLIPYH